MKFVMSLLVVATFATPALAADKTVAEKNRKDLVKVTQAAKGKTQEKNEEEMRGAGAYRLVDIKDPNDEKGSKGEKSWSVAPWTGSNRKRILTPEEMRRENEEGKYSTFVGSEVGLKYSSVYGAKVKFKLGGASQ